ncbi:hypothetical protein RR46_06037 [Papilio xuthus]|uniref:Uncharacterized protein n=1 Tax=Papilio xuthus TaxID=66420 RepID=A0A194QE50_PAPXU|nr:hypothetical protein RR46_06037 [Papilio xuthus]
MCMAWHASQWSGAVGWAGQGIHSRRYATATLHICRPPAGAGALGDLT